ncbi:hypothetical protein MLD38_011189 [Melastoma candidum]|uniref:Uncharacterized protein n=1 Tax=Melastoma candidum TaxID=119954 RepID=A0ACB9R2B8_9MYRT|nr:hypothetical protein MLD38_011189 [Melastoma candidum]
MDVELGTNAGSVILSLMGVDDRPRKKLTLEHKRVLSDEYHLRVASMASHLMRSPLKWSSVETNQSSQPSHACTAIGQNKHWEMSIDNEEENSHVVADGKNAFGEVALVDELVSGIYSSCTTPRVYVPFNNTSDPLTSSRARLSRKRPFGGSHMDKRYENYLADLLSAHLDGRFIKSQSSAASSVVYTERERVKGRERVASEPSVGSEVAVEKLHVEPKDGDRLPRTPGTTGVPTSCFETKGNCCPLPAYLSVEATKEVYEIEQETSPNDSKDSFCTDRSGIETDSFESFKDKYLRSPDSVLEAFDEGMPSRIITTLFEQEAHVPSTTWSRENGIVVLSNEGCENQCGGGYTNLDNSKPVGIRKNREFNYVIEILTEAGFCRRNLLSYLDKWHTLQSPLSPFVFESVEKRYVDDKSWEASDRELMFDRMNSWLGGFLQRSMPIPMRHVPGRISNQFHRDVDEEALWSSLVKEDKEPKGDSIEDLLKRDLGSLDLAEFLESIVAEIDWSVIDKLVAELIDGN